MFQVDGIINWQYGLILALGNASGGWFMSRYSAKKGDGFVRILLIVVVSILALKLLLPNLLSLK